MPAALEFLQHTLETAGQGSEALPSTYRMQLIESDSEDSLSERQGTYCHHYPICVRRISPDETLICMACGRTENALGYDRETPDGVDEEDWYSITPTNYHNETDLAAFETLSEFLANSISRLFGARPHRGKRCPLPAAQLRTLDPNLDQFSAVRAAFDANGFFANRWTE
ncbi:MAG: D-arabinono-1,4-lactone oxidase [Rubripirellula sp.]|nr:D-arabinono-1,4-lactone oxidase [Rubripirellula sp.]